MLKGALPAQWPGSMARLARLVLDGNAALCGPLPASWAKVATVAGEARPGRGAGCDMLLALVQRLLLPTRAAVPHCTASLLCWLPGWCTIRYTCT